MEYPVIKDMFRSSFSLCIAESGFSWAGDINLGSIIAVRKILFHLTYPPRW